MGLYRGLAECLLAYLTAVSCVWLLPTNLPWKKQDLNVDWFWSRLWKLELSSLFKRSLISWFGSLALKNANLNLDKNSLLSETTKKAQAILDVCPCLLFVDFVPSVRRCALLKVQDKETEKWISPHHCWTQQHHGTWTPSLLVLLYVWGFCLFSLFSSTADCTTNCSIKKFTLILTLGHCDGLVGGVVLEILLRIHSAGSPWIESVFNITHSTEIQSSWKALYV